MGGVRRDVNWRLEKRGEGEYEITFREETQSRVRTSDASRRGIDDPLFDTVPVREVSSYAEVDGLFEEKAHGPPPLGANATRESPGNSARKELSLGEGDIELDELLPSGIGLAFSLAGGLILYTFRGAGNSLLLLFGALFLVAGVLPFVYAAYLSRIEGPRAAWAFLVTVEDTGSTSTSSPNDTEKTPPAPEKLKHDITSIERNRDASGARNRSITSKSITSNLAGKGDRTSRRT